MPHISRAWVYRGNLNVVQVYVEADNQTNGTPTAAQLTAVAQAVARNPIAIVVPCHRVIGSDGSLTGFGGGLAAKQYLLELEGAIRQPTLYGALTAGGSRRRSRRAPSA